MAAPTHVAAAAVDHDAGEREALARIDFRHDFTTTLRAAIAAQLEREREARDEAQRELFDRFELDDELAASRAHFARVRETVRAERAREAIFSRFHGSMHAVADAQAWAAECAPFEPRDVDAPDAATSQVELWQVERPCVRGQLSPNVVPVPPESVGAVVVDLMLARERLRLAKAGKNSGSGTPGSSTDGSTGSAGRSPCVLAHNSPHAAAAARPLGRWEVAPPRAVEPAYPTEAYMGRVERLTGEFREGVAAAHRDSARDALELARLAALHPDATPPTVARVRRRDPESGELFERPTKVQISARVAHKVTAKWHSSRGEGIRRRFVEVTKCGEGVVTVACACSHAAAQPLGCGTRLLCVKCRNKNAKRRRERVWYAFESACAEARGKGLYDRHRRGGRVSEKFVTLTVPHVRRGSDAETTKARVALLFDAWTLFLKAWRRWLRGEQDASHRAWRAICERIRRAGGDVAAAGPPPEAAPLWWWRGFEWTPGGDLLGHPHLHLWALCEFLPRNLVRVWWADALQAVGVTADEGATPERVIVDVREIKRRATERPMGELVKGRGALKLVRDGFVVEAKRQRGDEASAVEGGATKARDLVQYIEGWVVAEKDAQGRHIRPETHAALYEALHGRRMSQASAGLLARGDRPCACPACGTVGELKAAIVQWWSSKWWRSPLLAAWHESRDIVRAFGWMTSPEGLQNRKALRRLDPPGGRPGWAVPHEQMRLVAS